MNYKGLHESSIPELRKKYGENILPTREKETALRILLRQFKSPLIYILFFAGTVSLYLKEYHDLWLIGAVLILDVIMGFYQEYSAQRTLSALTKIVKLRAMVVRDGQRMEIEAKDLVPKDIVILSSGDRVPADGIVLEGYNLLASEAVLTGEEEAVKKDTGRKVFMGTTILSGTGIFEVKKIRTATEIGKIGKSLVEIKKEKTPLQIKLEKLSRNLAYFIVLVCLIIFLMQIIFFHQNIWEMLRFAVVLAVAVVPEGLPIAVTVIMALGMRRIFKKHGLVKRLLAIETLGSASVICTDKTGTLTEGIMRVVKTDFKEKRWAHLAMILTNERRSGLEASLWKYVGEHDSDPEKLSALYSKIHAEPFDSEKKYSFVINKVDGKDIAFILGAPEIVLEFTSLPAEEKRAILEEIEKWAGEGLRILGMAMKEAGNILEKKNCRWLGIVGIEDPLRKNAKEAIQKAREAGIDVKIVTGDYRRTAEKVAVNLGFEIKDRCVLEGAELEKMPEPELRRRIGAIEIFARITPTQKLKIIQALQERGEVVAMTGDGVNDAPALKRANIGVAVGSATEVAKETADLILLDNNFKTIVEAVEEGRLVFSNMKKVVGYILSNSFAEVVLILGAMLLGLPFPITVIQILFIQLICDGPPDIILSFEPKERHLMKEDPRSIRREEIIGGPMKFLIFSISMLAGLFSLGFFRHYYKTGNLELARTMAFATLAIVDLIYIFSFKSIRRSIFKTENFWKNKLLFGGVVYGFILVALAIYLPKLNSTLHTVPLTAKNWLLPLGASVFLVLVIEITKLFNKRKKYLRHV
jgi:Ca2+-transporting ATPase